MSRARRRFAQLVRSVPRSRRAAFLRRLLRLIESDIVPVVAQTAVEQVRQRKPKPKPKPKPKLPACDSVRLDLRTEDINVAELPENDELGEWTRDDLESLRSVPIYADENGNLASYLGIASDCCGAKQFVLRYRKGTFHLSAFCRACGCEVHRFSLLSECERPEVGGLDLDADNDESGLWE